MIKKLLTALRALGRKLRKSKLVDKGEEIFFTEAIQLIVAKYGGNIPDTDANKIAKELVKALNMVGDRVFEGKKEVEDG